MAPLKTHRVRARLTLDRVAAVARIPHERVITGAQQGPSLPPFPSTVSLPSPPSNVSHSGATEQVVVPGSAGDRRPDAIGEDPVALVNAHEVVAGPGIDGDPRNLLALEAEVGRAVVADVDLQNAGLPALRRSAILSRALVPVIVSTRCLSFGRSNLTFFACAALTDAPVDAAFPESAAIPAAPAMTAAMATAEAASSAARDSFVRMWFFICARPLSFEPRGGS